MPQPAFTADPAQGRVFRTSRVVRSVDVTPAGRLRFDALARYLQQAAEDDLADASWAVPYTWLVRKTSVLVRGYPAHRDRVQLRTFCSATGPRWAERTTTVAGPAGDLVQATAVWVAIDAADGRPVPLGDVFHQVYGPSTGGRQVSARLSHPGPPETADADAGAGRPWPLRASDFDTAGHVNNSIHWAAVEDVLAGLDWLPSRAELEYHRPVLPGHDPRLLTERRDGQLLIWLTDDGDRLASAVLR
ncbi:MAG TPA: acyl-ACP thioesterase domain-containing protein [Streptosporangiaceae bacterium]